jgi:hypothetical protein
MKKKEIVKVLSKDGEIHFVFQEDDAGDGCTECICLEDPAVASALKREAARPLLILRAE